MVMHVRAMFHPQENTREAQFFHLKSHSPMTSDESQEQPKSHVWFQRPKPKWNSTVSTTFHCTDYNEPQIVSLKLRPLMIQEMWPDGNMSHPVFPEIVVIDIGYHLIKRVSLIMKSLKETMTSSELWAERPKFRGLLIWKQNNHGPKTSEIESGLGELRKTTHLDFSLFPWAVWIALLNFCAEYMFYPSRSTLFYPRGWSVRTTSNSGFWVGLASGEPSRW